jgi:hypothetical protein
MIEEDWYDVIPRLYDVCLCKTWIALSDSDEPILLVQILIE